MENFPCSDELEDKFLDLWQKNECLYDVSSNRSSSVVGPVYSDTTVELSCVAINGALGVNANA